MSLRQRGRAERPRDKLFACAALAANEDGHVGVGDPLDEILHLGHPLAVAEHLVFRLRLQLIAERRDFAGELMLAQRIEERHLEVRVVEWLADEVGRAELHRLHDRRGSAQARQDHHRNFAVDLPERGERGEPVHIARHDEVEDDGRRALVLEVMDSVDRVAQRNRLIPSLGKERFEKLSHGGIVVDHHDEWLTVEIQTGHAVQLSNANARAALSSSSEGSGKNGREASSVKRETPKTRGSKLPNY